MAPKVLFVVHHRLADRRGGAQLVSDQLYRALREGGEFEPMMVSRVGPPQSASKPRDGTRFALDDEDQNHYSIYTDLREFDTLLWTARSKELYTTDWRRFLLTVQPDVVHFRHALWLGYDMLRETRRTLPDVPIVYTLHEFLSICHHNGQMVRTGTNELCHAASPRRCHQCFPDVSAQDFLLRERFIKSALESVDMFIAPSEHLRERYIQWGIPPERIRYEDTGMALLEPLPDPPDAGRRRSVGFFAAITRYKGLDVLLEAMEILQAQAADVRLRVHGANIEVAPRDFREKIKDLLERTAGTVEFEGTYEHEQLPQLLAAVDWSIVPSIWWEVGPNSIREAMMLRRPVICSDIGAMAERIADGVNGLHFRVGDPVSLAATIRHAVDSPELWDQLRNNIADPHSIDRHLAAVTGIYNELLARRKRRARGKRSSRSKPRSLVASSEE